MKLRPQLGSIIWPATALTALAVSLTAAEWTTITPFSGWKQHSMSRPKPPVVTPAAGYGIAPADAVVIFDGKSLDEFQGQNGKPAGWTVGDGYFEVKPGAGAIYTKKKFGDVQMHLEWASPKPALGVGQDRGNSGVFLMENFEIQVLDSYKADTYADGQAGSIYGQYPPLANASLPPGEWQTYDIAFRKPRFDASGKLTEPARITVIHNGILVQNNEIVYGPTSWLKFDPYSPLPEKAPLEFQDHGHKVRYRNIWVRELAERPAPDANELKPIQTIAVAREELQKLAGEYRISTKPNAKPMTVRAEADHLIVKYPNRLSQLKLVPVAKNVFQFTETDARYEFSEDGKEVKFHIGGETRVLPKIEK